MATFHVSLTIPEIEANSPEEAVKTAWDYMTDGQSEGFVFELECEQTNDRSQVETFMQQGVIVETKYLGSQ